jgi:hypothetical protein
MGNNSEKPSLSNEQVIDYLVGDNSILDSKVQSIFIKAEDEKVNLEIELIMRASAEHSVIRLVFSDCVGYSFSYSDDYIFYNVESFKLIKTEGGLFYMSIDPFDDIQLPSDEDMDAVESRSIELFFVN